VPATRRGVIRTFTRADPPTPINDDFMNLASVPTTATGIGVVAALSAPISF